MHRPLMKAAIYRRYGPPDVAAVGSSVTRFAVGDKVFAARLGCHAEYVTVSEDNVAPKPDNLTFDESAALLFGGLTSLFYLRDKARIQPGERVLINGASGAVGTAAVQLARHFGARVTGVCSAANAPLVKSLGAEHVVDYSREDFAQAREAYDIILDAVGNCTFARCKLALAANGRLLLVVSSLGQMVRAQVWPSREGRRVLAGTGRCAPQTSSSCASSPNRERSNRSSIGRTRSRASRTPTPMSTPGARRATS
jgi:NADPH:quinone reductase-like Zn-dependent oxidoreductase